MRAETVVDLCMIALLGTIFVTTLRYRTHGNNSVSRIVPTSILIGISIMSLVFFTDLFLRYVAPVYAGPQRAFEVWSRFQEGYRWIFPVLSTPFLASGFLYYARERTEERSRIQETESRYKSIVQDHVDMIIRWKGDGIRTWVNEPYCRAFGLSADEAIGTSFYPLLKDHRLIRRRRDALTPDSPVYSSLQEIELPDGKTSWQEWTTRGLFDESGELVELQSIGRDITDRIRTARALQESEARFRGLVENTLEWVFELNLEPRCTYSNRAVESILGHSPEELSQLALTDIVHPDDLPFAAEVLKSAQAERTGWHHTNLRFLHKNGSTRYVESSASAIFDQHGVMTGFRGVGHDSTLHALLQNLSLDLANRTYSDIDIALKRSFEQIAQSYGVDRIGFWQLRENYSSRSHQWSREGVAQPARNTVCESEVPDISVELRNNRMYKLTSLNQLPPDSKDREFLRLQQVKSLLVIAIHIDDHDIGSMTFSTVTRERDWPDLLVSELKLLAEKIILTHQRATSEISIRRHQRDLARSEELAHVGSYAFYPEPAAGGFPDGWRARFSSELCRLLQAEPAEASFDLLVSRIHREDRPRFVEGIQNLVSSGQRLEAQYRIVNPDGSQLHIMSRAERELDGAGEISRIIGSNRDITKQVKRESDLVAALAENERLRSRLEEENVQLREEMRSLTGFDQIIGDSAALRASLNLAARAAPTDSTILILGETGTGKELVAKAIHQLSARSEKRLVSINCTALPPNLIESELFGHEKGAFTGASRRRAGRFELADGGTLFLDEIGDLPMDLQAKLLRVLEDGGFERLGGNRTIRPDVRLIAATNRNLEAAVRAGAFRADLYYRLNIVPIVLPPLRERKEDIPMLAQHFVEKHSARLGKSVTAISTRMIEMLLNRNWPGNVRELEHYIERSLISATGKVLSFDERKSHEDIELPIAITDRPTELRMVEREHILQVLTETGWVIDGQRGAAAVLGLAPSTLRSRMKRLGIVRSAVSRSTQSNETPQ